MRISDWSSDVCSSDLGEYYTPRPLIRAMIREVQPRIGERIYDGACGSAGFLCEAYEHMKPQARSTADHETLQRRTFFAKEKKSLAYVIAIMNMIQIGRASCRERVCPYV